MSENKIKTAIILNIHKNNAVDYIVRNSEGIIHEITSIENISSSFKSRYRVLNILNNLVQNYNIDYIILEENKLFIDRISFNPEPNVLRNIIKGFTLTVTIDNYFHENENKIEIYCIPRKDWMFQFFGLPKKYAIDLYKNYFLSNSYYFTNVDLEKIEELNLYEVITFSDVIIHRNLLKNKYKIN